MFCFRQKVIEQPYFHTYEVRMYLDLLENCPRAEKDKNHRLSLLITKQRLEGEGQQISNQAI